MSENRIAASSGNQSKPLPNDGLHGSKHQTLHNFRLADHSSRIVNGGGLVVVDCYSTLMVGQYSAVIFAVPIAREQNLGSGP